MKYKFILDFLHVQAGVEPTVVLFINVKNIVSALVQWIEKLNDKCHSDAKKTVLYPSPPTCVQRSSSLEQTVRGDCVRFIRGD